MILRVGDSFHYKNRKVLITNVDVDTAYGINEDGVGIEVQLSGTTIYGVNENDVATVFEFLHYGIICIYFSDVNMVEQILHFLTLYKVSKYGYEIDWHGIYESIGEIKTVDKDNNPITYQCVNLMSTTDKLVLRTWLYQRKFLYSKSYFKSTKFDIGL